MSPEDSRTTDVEATKSVDHTPCETIDISEHEAVQERTLDRDDEDDDEDNDDDDDNSEDEEDGASGEDDGDEGDEEEEDEEEEQVEWLASGRERRSTAGRNMKSLLAAQEEDEELDLLFAEVEEEDHDFESSEAEAVQGAADDDDDSTSSSDEDDKPVDEMEGEKALQQEERAARRASKRKQTFKIPTIRKRPRIDDLESSSSASPSTDRPKKKPERVSWLPSERAGPLRASSRTLSVQRKKQTIANLKEAEKKRVRLQKVADEANKRNEATKKKTMTQAERLAEAAETERLNTRSLHRWEEYENERLRKQQERLAQMHSRVIEGPFVRYYSGPGEWWDGVLKRVGNPSHDLEVLDDPVEKPQPKRRKNARIKDESAREASKSHGPGRAEQKENTTSKATVISDKTPTKDAAEKVEVLQPLQGENVKTKGIEVDGVDVVMKDENDLDSTTAPSETAKDLSTLDHSETQQANTTQSQSTESQEKATDIEMIEAHPSTVASAHKVARSEPSLDDGAAIAGVQAQDEPPAENQPLKQTEPAGSIPPSKRSEPLRVPSQVPTTGGFLDGIEYWAGLSIEPSTNNQPFAPSSDDDAVVEGEEREEEAPQKKVPSLIEYSAYKSIGVHNIASGLPSSPAMLSKIFLGYNPASRLVKTNPHFCAVSNQPARYKDPATGLPFRGIEEFKMIRRVAGLSGPDRPMWSTLLEAYVGRGLPATGVPESFITGKVKDPPPPPKQQDESRPAHSENNITSQNKESPDQSSAPVPEAAPDAGAASPSTAGHPVST